MTHEEASKKIVEALGEKKNKTRFYFNDLVKMLGLKHWETKKIINKMVQDGILEYWSSGSTTLCGLRGVGKQAKAESEA